VFNARPKIKTRPVIVPVKGAAATAPGKAAPARSVVDDDDDDDLDDDDDT
jgi:hypothetical protein